MKKETLEDLSKITGFSKTTISRVLNGKSKEFRINEETCEQIISVAKELNYRPNLVAQFLRKAEGRTLGIAVPYISNPFFAQLVSTITIEAIDPYGNKYTATSNDVVTEPFYNYAHYYAE